MIHKGPGLFQFVKEGNMIPYSPGKGVDPKVMVPALLGVTLHEYVMLEVIKKAVIGAILKKGHTDYSSYIGSSLGAGASMGYMSLTYNDSLGKTVSKIVDGLRTVFNKPFSLHHLPRWKESERGWQRIKYEGGEITENR